MPSLEDGLYDLGRLDRLAALDTPVHRLDPRAKVLTTLVFLVCVVSFGTYELLPMAPFAFFPVALIAEGGLPAGFLLRKVLAVAPFAVFVGVFNPLIDRTIVAEIAGVAITGGWVSFVSILLRVLLTTQLLLLYRYIFVLGEETMRMARARALRSFGRRGMGLGVYVNMLGSLLLRTYARAERVYRAMLARGFDGRVRTLGDRAIGGRDVVFTLGWSAAFVLFRIYNVPLALGTVITELMR